MIKKSILLVDDDKRLRELLEDYLNEKNFQVFTSEDFDEAREILGLFLFDLIILDRMMPSGDGINLIQDIKKASKTPIIMLTAMGENNDKIDGLKTGTDDYLSKPFEPEELFLRINNLLQLYGNINKAELLFSFGSFIYNTKTNSLKLNDKEILDVLSIAGKEKAVVMVHAENHECIMWLTEKLESEGKIAPKYHAVSRPTL